MGTMKKSASKNSAMKTGEETEEGTEKPFSEIVLEASRAMARSKLHPGLYVIPTPIGNLGDITLRALDVLTRVDLIFAEDTRSSGLLLSRYGIKKPMKSFHDHNEDEKIHDVIAAMQKNMRVGLVADAGMPLIADPGFRLMRLCRDQKIAVTVLPGANAALTALAGSGLPTDAFSFHGFLPSSRGKRQSLLQDLSTRAETLIFYEAPHRLLACLEDITHVAPARPVVIARELTKLYEESRAGTAAELLSHYKNHPAKGEIVILLGGTSFEESKLDEDDLDAVLRTAMQKLSLRDAVALVAKTTSWPKKTIYAAALRLSDAKEN
jgi:16S rRNA (cytidine1402-2'-O)-methyltransferase